MQFNIEVALSKGCILISLIQIEIQDGQTWKNLFIYWLTRSQTCTSAHVHTHTHTQI